ncbi:MAG: hypothetical protein NTW96_14250 [Planctomycetia bacterium]|nr:hypothetical protein [Planctomycetia bacterium]
MLGPAPAGSFVRYATGEPTRIPAEITDSFPVVEQGLGFAG